jgi:formamidopyrimidine-DNA glycosylase
MPEGPEVRTIVHYLSDKIEGKIIQQINILGGRYSRTLPTGWDLLIDNLPVQIDSIDSKGKFMWISTSSGTDDDTKIFIMNTLGLTGQWTDNPSKEHNNVEFVFTEGDPIYFNDVRNFGTLKITDEYKDIEKKLKELGPDFLQSGDDYKEADFIAKIETLAKKKGREMTIYETFMDQKKLGSGIGNYLVTEILYMAKISPNSTLPGLAKNKELCAKLLYCIKYKMKQAFYFNKTGYMTMFSNDDVAFLDNIPNVYLPKIEVKEPFEFHVYNRKTDKLGNKIENASIVKGRTAHWVPDVQVEYQ